jgi:hypothetical protein
MVLRCHKFIIPVFLAMFISCQAISQIGSLPESFMAVDAEPQSIVCQNEIKVNDQGGHLQGIQILVKNDEAYAIISGSSEAYAYYSVVELGTCKVLSVNKLMYQPFKHAGGIQILQDLMVVGIEDNDLKNRSRVCIYEIGDPANPPVIPLIQIEREGVPLRSTAGCCAMNRMENKCLVVVGDWDTKHLDFYICDEHQLTQRQNAFEKVYTMDTEKIDRTDWADKEWHAYQNINLLRDKDGKSYLFGFGQNVHEENIADLFLVENRDLREFWLKKLISKTFNCKRGADFRSGAGIFLEPDGNMKVISCGPHIRDSLILNVFD